MTSRGINWEYQDKGPESPREQRIRTQVEMSAAGYELSVNVEVETLKER